MSLIKLLSFHLIVCCYLLTNQVYASCSPYPKGKNSTINPIYQSIGLGHVVAKPTDAIGKVLKEQTFTLAPNNSYITCSNYLDRFTVRGVLTQNRPQSRLRNKIYSTNLNGIGIRISILQDAQQDVFPFTYRISTTNPSFDNKPYPYLFEQNISLKVEIIKTGNYIEAGSLNSDIYAIAYINNYRNAPLLIAEMPVNATTVSAASCMLTNNNHTVVLPNVSQFNFKGIGSTQGEQNFQLNMTCNGGESNTRYSEANQIGVNFSFIPSPNNSEAIKNTATTNPSSGVDLQLLWSENNQIIKNHYNYNLGFISSGDTEDFPIALKARYIQTKPQITPGEVQGLATITINYN